MSDFLEPVRKNLKVIVVAAVAAIAVAVAVGFIIGMSQRKPAFEELEAMPFTAGTKEPVQGVTGLLIPQPVFPRIAADDEHGTLSFDRHPEFIDEIELMPVKLSELIMHRERGVQSEVKPFQFMGEELDILTSVNEIAEP